MEILCSVKNVVIGMKHALKNVGCCQALLIFELLFPYTVSNLQNGNMTKVIGSAMSVWQLLQLPKPLLLI